MRHYLTWLRATILLAACACCYVAASSLPTFNGTWRGTFKDLAADPKKADEANEETHRFELTLHEANGKIYGTFRQLDSHRRSQKVKHAKRFGDRACFDIDYDEDEDMRMCVVLEGGDLVGVWNGGPEGGPVLDGLGAGARLFDVKAKRVSEKGRSQPEPPSLPRDR